MKFGQLQALYHQPLFDLISKSRAVHLQHWRGEEVQRCSLLSIKTGGCSEDCAYCAQSAHYSTGLEREELLSLEEVMTAAHRARSQGATRFCMGAAWRGVRDGSEKFERVLEIVREVSGLGMEVCVTLGEIGPVEARKLKAAGVTAYNHNIDTSPEFYPEIVSTHSFQDRLNTIAAVQGSGMSVCCGGIIGMGESENDRLCMIEILSELDPPPQSVPINCLIPQSGTPLADQPSVDVFDWSGCSLEERFPLARSHLPDRPRHGHCVRHAWSYCASILLERKTRLKLSGCSGACPQPRFASARENTRPYTFWYGVRFAKKRTRRRPFSLIAAAPLSK